jgi:hypothetical protein
MNKIDQQITNEFKAAVLAHIVDVLPVSQWDRFRAIAADPASGKVQGPALIPLATPADLVSAALSQDDLTLAESLPKPYRPLVEEIGAVAGMPVFYVSGEGVYLWSADEKSDVLSIWLTHPAYPPSW